MPKKLFVPALSLVPVISAAVGVASYIARHPRPFPGGAEDASRVLTAARLTVVMRFPGELVRAMY
jgi:hypothetical protein